MGDLDDRLCASRVDGRDQPGMPCLEPVIVQAQLRNVGAESRLRVDPGEFSDDKAGAAACALDAAVHEWDVAVATGQPSPLTDDLATSLEPAARAVAEPLRGFAYAAPLAAQAGDGPAAALLRYLGRDPEWTA